MIFLTKLSCQVGYTSLNIGPTDDILKRLLIIKVLKEIRFGPNTDEHDFQFKLKHATKFLSEGAKLKAFVFLIYR